MVTARLSIYNVVTPILSLQQLHHIPCPLKTELKTSDLSSLDAPLLSYSIKSDFQ